MKESYNLPNGKTTYNSREYVEEWRKKGKIISELFNGKLHGFDPDFSVYTNQRILEIERTIALKLIELSDDRDRLRKENSQLRKKLGK